MIEVVEVFNLKVNFAGDSPATKYPELVGKNMSFVLNPVNNATLILNVKWASYLQELSIDCSLDSGEVLFSNYIVNDAPVNLFASAKGTDGYLLYYYKGFFFLCKASSEEHRLLGSYDFYNYRLRLEDALLQATI